MTAAPARLFRKVALFGKPRAEGIGAPLQEIVRIVQAAGCEVLLDAATRETVGLAQLPGHSLEEIGAAAD
ncbi:MAG: hypothetical protein ACK53M_13540, partial [Betaproteobacteria bacterium]